jgi:hypothetical protein
MRLIQTDSDPALAQPIEQHSLPKRATANHRLDDLIPLYDIEQFLFLVERERARADRAAARPPKAPRHRPAASHGQAAHAAAAAKGQPKPSNEGVWGATTDNREFSLVIFRPSSRADRAGLVDLLQACVRTTDTAAENASLFVKKVLAIAREQEVHMSHIVHTYPAAWPDEDSPLWNEPKHAKDQSATAEQAPQPLPRAHRREADRSVLSGLVNWLQNAAARRASRRPVRASA